MIIRPREGLGAEPGSCRGWVSGVSSWSRFFQASYPHCRPAGSPAPSASPQTAVPGCRQCLQQRLRAGLGPGGWTHGAQHCRGSGLPCFCGPEQAAVQAAVLAAVLAVRLSWVPWSMCKCSDPCLCAPCVPVSVLPSSSVDHKNRVGVSTSVGGSKMNLDWEFVVELWAIRRSCWSCWMNRVSACQ